MSSKSMFIAGLAWLGAIVLWSLFGPKAFSIALRGDNGHKAGIFTAYLLGTLLTVFQVGWIVLLALGTYRLVKKH